MNLIIDVGNTNVKFAIFSDEKLIHKEIFSNSNWPEIEMLRNEIYSMPIDQVIFSSVSLTFEQLFPAYPQRWRIVHLSHQLKLPITIQYATPHTLGLDRIAALSGAAFLFPGENILVLDAGTALTIDFLNAENIFLGGNISPGIRTRFRALNTFTHKLPLVEPDVSFAYTGKSTASAINGGVMAGIIFEVNGYIDYYKSIYRNLKIIITGGEYEFFVNYINSPIFAEPNLVLIGLNRILENNV